MSDLKTLIISRMENGANILNELAVSKRIGKDITVDASAVEKKINQYHPNIMKLIVSETENIGNYAKKIRFVSETGFLPIFEAGQYINLFVQIEGVRTSRPYSLSSSPKERSYFEIIVARQEKGFVSDYLIDNVKAGDRFEANGPAGVFHFNPVFHHKRQVFLAGGSGITPFLSMSREILHAGLDREVYLIYGTRNEDLAINHEELTRLSAEFKNFHYSLVVSNDPECKKYRTGFIDAECIKALVPDYKNATYYICGPEIMNQFCSKTLTEIGILPKHIRREMFGARQDIQNEPGWPENLSGKETFTIKVGDKKIPALSGESVLTALERSGIRMNVCCRSGECSLCRIRLVSGTVFTARGVLSRYADELFNYIHSCKVYPISDLEVIL